MKAVIFRAGLYIAALLFLPVIILLVMIRRWVLITFGSLVSTRIGHFADNPEQAICAADLRLFDLGQRCIGIWCFAVRPGTITPDVCNTQLAIMWKRVMYIWPVWLIVPAIKAAQWVPTGHKHVRVMDSIGLDGDHDVYDFYGKCNTHLSFSAEEIELGHNLLKEFGIKSTDDIVCLHVRDSSYLNTYHAGKDWTYHNYRDSDINTYAEAAILLAEKGSYVFRMGKSASKPFNVQHDRVIDYAFSKKRSDFLDVFLAWRCKFAISTGSGWDSLPAVFRRPIAYVNFCPLGHVHSYRRNSIFISKWYVNRLTGKRLNINKIFSSPIAYASSSDEFQQHNIQLIDNSASEIRNVALEMWERCYGIFFETKEDSIFQQKFWESFRFDGFSHSGHRLHGDVNAKCSAVFLRENPWFVDHV